MLVRCPEVMSTHIFSVMLETLSHSNRLSGSIYAADAHTWRPSWKCANYPFVLLNVVPSQMPSCVQNTFQIFESLE